MKKFRLVFILLILTSTGWSQSMLEITTVKMGFQKNAEKSFWLKGDASSKLVTKMWEKYGDGTKKKFVNNFKKIRVPGINEMVSFKVQEGVYGDKTADQCSGSYFNTFTSNKYRKERIARMTELEQFGVIVYVKKKGGERITTKSEEVIIQDFIRALLVG